LVAAEGGLVKKNLHKMNYFSVLEKIEKIPDKIRQNKTEPESLAQ